MLDVAVQAEDWPEADWEGLAARAGHRPDAADLFDRYPLYVLVELVVDGGRVVEGRCNLVAESRRPCGQRRYPTSLVGDASIYLDDVGVVETESLADGKLLVRIFERHGGRSALLALMGCHVQSRTQFSPQIGVIRPKRERVAELRCCCGIDQIQPPILRLIVKFLQDPGLNLCATVREGNSI